MATLEELEARVQILEGKYADFASSDDMLKAQRTISALETALGNVSNKIGNLPSGKTVVGYVDEKTANAGGGGLSREEIEEIIAASDAGLSEEEVNALLEPIKSDIKGIKLDTNNIKNAPKYKLMWTASELQAVLGGVLDGETTIPKPYDGSVTITGGEI